jgi:hypothetical protein
MSVLGGEDMVVQVETATPGTFIPVADMDRYTTNNNRDKGRFPVFNGIPHVTVGQRVKTFTVSGFLNNTDAGQQRIRAMEAADTPVKLRVLPDGVNGMEVSVLVNTTGHEASADETSLQTFSFDCEATADPVPVGTGIVV